MYKQKDYESALADFKKNNEIESAKYQSEHSDAIILAYLVQTQRLSMSRSRIWRGRGCYLPPRKTSVPFERWQRRIWTKL
jgi:hypothetical protein